MEIVKTQIELKAFGKDYTLSPPTARKVALFQKQIGEAKENELQTVEIAAEFLVECGLPKDVCDQLEMDHLGQLITLISSKKK
jgi:hypothetical protein